MAFTLTFVMDPRKDISEDPHKAVNLALGKRLAHIRSLRVLSQQELAQRVNVVQDLTRYVKKHINLKDIVGGDDRKE